MHDPASLFSALCPLPSALCPLPPVPTARSSLHVIALKTSPPRASDYCHCTLLDFIYYMRCLLERVGVESEDNEVGIEWAISELIIAGLFRAARPSFPPPLLSPPFLSPSSPPSSPTPLLNHTVSPLLIPSNI
ncbi:hypothetical protein BOTBODRAFT_47458 [Botryobasidium botryosum FD-172 SS1]|uniref:Uncharacterized protein n=1 Tax=Botryobasidium botryosum (strain FD-172 SS1) TaxID=930990 RepID=A0A067M2D8_BOTB1|nr:hypothetical protein BOTBODRAFT_47458 [Botryobasidium botryosum FD-172 SS1]